MVVSFAENATIASAKVIKELSLGTSAILASIARRMEISMRKYIEKLKKDAMAMNKLCCVLNPEFRCIGCDVPICVVCAGPEDITGRHSLPECKATYYCTWLYDDRGHAFNDISSLEQNRADEVKEANRGQKKSNGKTTLLHS